MLNKIAADEGIRHRDIFGELSTIYDINCQKIGTESHNSFSISERYHDPLRKAFLRLREDDPSLKNDVLLARNTKEIN